MVMALLGTPIRAALVRLGQADGAALVAAILVANIEHPVSAFATTHRGVGFPMGPIKSDPKILGGTPCFAGTRVPVAALIDHLEEGHNIDFFLSQFPTVGRDQVQAVLELMREDLPQQARRAAG